MPIFSRSHTYDRLPSQITKSTIGNRKSAIFLICVICGFAFLVLGLQGCGARRQASTPNSSVEAPTGGARSTGAIKDVQMAKDDGKGGPADPADTFGGDDKTIHCVVELAEPKPNTKIRYSWWVVDAGETKNEKIDEFEYTTTAQDRIVHSHLTVPNDWPPGSYKVDVYVNGNLEQTASFKVE